MQFTVAKSNLLPMLVACERATDREATMRILGNLLLRANDDVLVIVGTDLYMTTGGTIEARVKAPGGITLPAKELIERVSAMPKGPIDFSVKEDTAHISSGKRKYKLKGVAPDQFPAIPEVPAKVQAISIPSRKLHDMIKRTASSVSHDQTKGHMSGYCLQPDGTKLVMITTDGHRVSKVWWDSAKENRFDQIIIPSKAMDQIRRSASGTDAELVLRIGGGVMSVDAGPVRITCRLQNAKFPPCDNILQMVLSHKTIVRIGKEVLLEAVKAVSVASEKGAIGFAFDDAVARITASGSAEAEDEVSCVSHEGDKVNFLVDGVFFSDMVKSAEADEVSLMIGGEVDLIGVQSDDMIGAICPIKS